MLYHTCIFSHVFQPDVDLIKTQPRLKASQAQVAPDALTDLCHVQAVLLGGVVPAGGDGGHVHAVDLPYGRVAAVEVAAVGARRHVVRTLVGGAFAVDDKVSITRQKHMTPPS